MCQRDGSLWHIFFVRTGRDPKVSFMKCDRSRDSSLRGEKRYHSSNTDLRGPASTDAVFLMKTPSARAKSDLGNRFSPLVRLLACGVFHPLDQCSVTIAFHEAPGPGRPSHSEVPKGDASFDTLRAAEDGFVIICRLVTGDKKNRPHCHFSEIWGLTSPPHRTIIHLTLKQFTAKR